MLKKLEVDQSLFFGVFQELTLLPQKNLATNLMRHGVLRGKNKHFRSVVILFKEDKQLVRSGPCIDRLLGRTYVFPGGSERINFPLIKVFGS